MSNVIFVNKVARQRAEGACGFQNKGTDYPATLKQTGFFIEQKTKLFSDFGFYLHKYSQNAHIIVVWIKINS